MSEPLSWMLWVIFSWGQGGMVKIGDYAHKDDCDTAAIAVIAGIEHSRDPVRGTAFCVPGDTVYPSRHYPIPYEPGMEVVP